MIPGQTTRSVVLCRHGEEIACLACVISTWPGDHMTIGGLVAAREAIASARLALRDKR